MVRCSSQNRSIDISATKDTSHIVKVLIGVSTNNRPRWRNGIRTALKKQYPSDLRVRIPLWAPFKIEGKNMIDMILSTWQLILSVFGYTLAIAAGSFVAGYRWKKG